MTGRTSTGPSASSFSYSQSNTYSDSLSDYGNVTAAGVVTPFSESQASSATYRYSVTGPPVTTAYQQSIISSTLTGNTPYPANFTETVVAGHADTAGSSVAHDAGSAPANSAEHLGTTPNNLEGSGGLASGLGGFAVHSLLFAGPEVMAEVSSGGNSLVLQEAYSSSSPTNWVSHPTGIGYRRPAPANGGLPANSGNAPITDSGTTDGSNDQELARLTNFDSGGNENSTATQTAPTSRAEQQGGVATGTGTGPSGTDANGGDGGYYDDGGQWRPLPGTGGGGDGGDGGDEGDGGGPVGIGFPADGGNDYPYDMPVWLFNPLHSLFVFMNGDDGNQPQAPAPILPPPPTPCAPQEQPIAPQEQGAQDDEPESPEEGGTGTPATGGSNDDAGDDDDDGPGWGGVGDYLLQSLRQLVMGNYTDDVTGLGTGPRFFQEYST